MSCCRTHHTFLLLIVSVFVLSTTALAQVAITTYRGDSLRSGVNDGETSLTPSNVNTTSFGKVFTATIPDGVVKVTAQPLYLPNVNVAGQGTHNVIYVATNFDHIYAYDADGNPTTPLWTADLRHGGATIPCGDLNACYIAQYIGIVSTPVIDQSTGTLYAVAQTEENGNIVQRLHAIDVTSGAEKFGGPVVIQASVAGTGTGSSGGTIVFQSRIQNQRASLLLANGRVYIAFGSYGDNGSYHGWILSYDAGTLGQVAVWNDTPNGDEGGIWAPGNLAADSSGNIYATVGNGASTAQNGGKDYGDSIVKLDASLRVLDFFMPPNYSQLNDLDLDLNGGGFVLTPSNIMLGGGKDGTLLVVDGNHLGGWSSTGSNVVQSIPNAVGGSGCSSEGCIYSVPTLFNGKLFYIGQDDVFKAFDYNGTLSGPTKNTAQTYSLRGAPTIVSSSGTSNGIVWAVFVDQPNGYGMTLYAYDAANPGTVLWNSNQSSADVLGKGTLFMSPVVANGKIYVAGQGQLSAFGLKSVGGSSSGGGGTTGTGTGTCAVPASPGVNVCSPTNNSTITSPFTISAAGKNTNGTSGLDVWIDGQKFGWYPGNSINVQATASNGKHELDIYSVGTDGELKETVTYFTIGTTTSGGGTTGGTGGGTTGGTTGCSARTSPGVTICTPVQGSTVTSPVQINAYGMNNGATDGMDVYIDGHHTGWYGGTTNLNISATLADGSHELDVYAVGVNGELQEGKVTFAVGTTTSGGGTTGGGTTGGGTSGGTSGSCAQPTSAGVNICSPLSGSTVSSPVTITASGRNTGTTAGLDVWIDGQKFGWYPQTSLSAQVTLGSGQHELDIYAVGTDGELQEKTVIFTVGSTSSGGGTGGTTSCSQPGSPGVVICAPSNGTTVNSPVAISAAGRNSVTTDGMDVYIDGKHTGWYGGVTTISISVALVSGAHQVDVYAVGTNGELQQSTAKFTVP